MRLSADSPIPNPSCAMSAAGESWRLFFVGAQVRGSGSLHYRFSSLFLFFLRPLTANRTFAIRRLTKVCFGSNARTSGPSKAWIKTKNVVENEFVLLRLERDTEGRPFAHVGREEAGMAFMTFGEKIHSELSRKAKALSRPACAVEGLKRPRATWLTPEIRVRVRHLRNGNGLRHASVRAILD